MIFVFYQSLSNVLVRVIHQPSAGDDVRLSELLSLCSMGGCFCVFCPVAVSVVPEVFGHMSSDFRYLLFCIVHLKGNGAGLLFSLPSASYKIYIHKVHNDLQLVHIFTDHCGGQKP